MPLFGPPNIDALRARGDLPGLIRALGHARDPSVRLAAAEVLGGLQDPRAVEPLAAALADPAPEVRRAAIGALAQIRDPRVAPALVTALGDADVDARRAAVGALGHVHDARVIPPVVAALLDRDWRVQSQALASLKQIGAAAIPALLQALADPPMARAAAAALDALGWEPGRDTPGARYRAVMHDWAACVEIGPPAVEALRAVCDHGSADVRQAAIVALGQIGARSAPGTPAQLIVDTVGRAASDLSPDVRRAAVESLGRALDSVDDVELRTTGIAHVVGALADGKESVRLAAVTVLGLAREPRAVEPLAAALRDTAEPVRLATVTALARIGNRNAVGVLRGALQDKHLAVAAAAALDALGWEPEENEFGAAYWIAKNDWARCAQLGDAAVVPLLVALESAAEATCCSAAMALGRIGSSLAVKPLAQVVAERAGAPRDAAVSALALIGAPGLDALLAALDSSDADVSRAASWALQRVGAPAVPALLIRVAAPPGTAHRSVAAETLARIGDTASGHLIAALSDPDAELRIAAAEALGQIASLRAVGPLALALEDEVPHVRASSAAALGHIGSPLALHSLVAALHDPVRAVRQAAARALGQIGDLSAMDALQAAAGDDERTIRAEAVEAMARLRGSRP